MMSKCKDHTKHKAAAYMKYVRTRASTASPQLLSGVELGKRSNVFFSQQQSNAIRSKNQNHLKARIHKNKKRHFNGV
ncbi:hypothetical protein [Candidatus Sarmatiella mevalonica]|uniref:hypothetical protein n=1 Tax=Candidatus Sarmatiella mevalonica TaxID=2770581 RepID=UPI0019226A33|nr:hypothetical protein [Candidatus Sarmatiella mevalonica]